MSFTVIPLHNLDIDKGTQIPFAKGFVLRDTPEWLKAALADLSGRDRSDTLNAPHALVAQYEANCWGYPDPDWKGDKPKSIQDLRFESAMLANMAIWLIQPSPVRFTIGFHALTKLEGRNLDSPLVGPTPKEGPLYCHPNDMGNAVSVKHLIRAAKLHEELSAISRLNSVWEALRAFWAALTMYAPDYRYPFFWLGLEALFGDEDRSRGLTKRVCQSIAFFIAENHQDAEHLYKMALRCYDMRSTIVHGRWENDPNLDSVMYETEAIVRTGLRLLMDRPDVLQKFLSGQRNEYLRRLRSERRSAGWLCNQPTS